MFDVDVTTLDDGLVPTQSIRMVIGGNSDWTNTTSGGFTYVTCFAWRTDLNETYTGCATAGSTARFVCEQPACTPAVRARVSVELHPQQLNAANV
jgi:hypothetical protein